MNRETSVAVTGIGLVTPAACTLVGFWTFLRKGVSAAADISRFEAGSLPVRFACEVDDGFDVQGALRPKQWRRQDRFSRFGSVAASSALLDAGISAVDDVDRAGVYVGCGFAGIATLDDAAEDGVLGGSQRRVHPTLLPRVMPNAAGAAIAMSNGWRGPNLTFSTVCAAGTHAIGEASRVIRSGDADLMLAGGVDAPICPFVLKAFHALRALSTRNDAPHEASRPFGQDRDGFVLGEGAAFLVLERAEDARARGARIYALLAGYARNADAHHLVMPEPDGSGARACMLRALADADIAPVDVVHVNAHGTSTPKNDAAEAHAIADALGDDHQASVTSVKGAVGHLMGAAGAVEAAAACLSIEHREIPPTANTNTIDPAIAVDIVTKDPRPLPEGAVLSNSFAFGGQNATLVLTPS